jgi:hypothetical protein
MNSLLRWPTTFSQLTRLCYATTYNTGGSSASYASTRGDCLATASASDSSWSVCLQVLSRFLSRRSRYRLCTDPTENTVPLLMWVRCYYVFRCSGSSCLAPDSVATPLPAVLLSLRDVPAVAETMSLASRSLATAVSLAPLFRLSGVISQNNTVENKYIMLMYSRSSMQTWHFIYLWTKSHLFTGTMDVTINSLCPPIFLTLWRT